MDNKLDAKWTKAMDEYIARIKKDYADWQDINYKSMVDLNARKLKEFNSKVRYDVMKNGQYIKVVLDPDEKTVHSFIVLKTDKSNNKPGDILPYDRTHRPKGNIFGKYEICWSGVNPPSTAQPKR
jgi:hypothetical protein